MNRARRRQSGKSAIELIEEAIHLLRAAPTATLAIYYLGSGPFVLGLLYFWADMSRSAFAAQMLANGGFAVALLFLWMKFCHALFARNLRALLMGREPAPLGFAGCRRIFVTQTALQPSGLFLLPLSLIPALPFGWMYAFYQNVTALADDEARGIKALLGRAARQTALWPGQNHLFLLIISTFGFFVFLNCISLCLLLPGLIKTLFGIESIFTRSVFSLLNTTFFAAMIGLAYLFVDPIIKAVYALRCFYGVSLRSGEDLKAELRQLAVPAMKVAACLLVGLAALTASPARCQTAEADISTEHISRDRNFTPRSSSVPPPELERAIQQTIQERKYAWRMPRDKNVEEETETKGVIDRFLERSGKMIKQWGRKAWEKLDEWLNKSRRNRSTGTHDSSGYGWIISLQILLFALVAGVVAALAVLLYRVWTERRKKAAAILSQPIRPAPDLADENVGAADLPEDGWTKLARELLERGELRLAMRAFYLASLAHLAGRNLISLAKFKSNRDYERELRRRGHSFEALLTVFGQNVSLFDRIWYGFHEVTAELVGQFAANVEKIKGAG